MTNANLQSLQQVLESRLKEATQPATWRDSITIEPSADPVDATQHTLEREMATRKLDRDAMIVREVRAAFARMQAGTYGVCTNCEEDISPRRLAAVPWAALCIHCQEEADGQLVDHADREYSRSRIAEAA
jgi:DnaK suppressor protein